MGLSSFNSLRMGMREKLVPFANFENEACISKVDPLMDAPMFCGKAMGNPLVKNKY